jgi:hypothetical protein
VREDCTRYRCRQPQEPTFSDDAQIWHEQKLGENAPPALPEPLQLQGVAGTWSEILCDAQLLHLQCLTDNAKEHTS